MCRDANPSSAFDDDMQVSEHFGGLQQAVVPLFLWYSLSARRHSFYVDDSVPASYRNNARNLTKLSYFNNGLFQ